MSNIGGFTSIPKDAKNTGNSGPDLLSGQIYEVSFVSPQKFLNLGHLVPG